MTQGVSPSMWTAAAAVAVAIAGAADSRRAAISGGIAGIASTAAWQLGPLCARIAIMIDLIT